MRKLIKKMQLSQTIGDFPGYAAISRGKRIYAFFADLAAKKQPTYTSFSVRFPVEATHLIHRQ